MVAELLRNCWNFLNCLGYLILGNLLFIDSSIGRHTAWPSQSPIPSPSSPYNEDKRWRNHPISPPHSERGILKLQSPTIHSTRGSLKLESMVVYLQGIGSCDNILTRAFASMGVEVTHRL
jgi:hypothetical protein